MEARGLTLRDIPKRDELEESDKVLVVDRLGITRKVDKDQVGVDEDELERVEEYSITYDSKGNFTGNIKLKTSKGEFYVALPWARMEWFTESVTYRAGILSGDMAKRLLHTIYFVGDVNTKEDLPSLDNASIGQCYRVLTGDVANVLWVVLAGETVSSSYTFKGSWRDMITFSGDLEDGSEVVWLERYASGDTWTYPSGENHYGKVVAHANGRYYLAACDANGELLKTTSGETQYWCVDSGGGPKLCMYGEWEVANGYIQKNTQIREISIYAGVPTYKYSKYWYKLSGQVVTADVGSGEGEAETVYIEVTAPAGANIVFNGATVSSGSTMTLAVENGSSVSMKCVALTGYTFERWSVGGMSSINGSGSEVTFVVNGTSSVSVNVREVGENAGGGTGDSGDEYTIYVRCTDGVSSIKVEGKNLNTVVTSTVKTELKVNKSLNTVVFSFNLEEGKTLTKWCYRLAGEQPSRVDSSTNPKMYEIAYWMDGAEFWVETE